MNHVAVVFWVICGLIGYLINPSLYGFVTGFLPAMLFSFILTTIFWR